MLVLPIKKKWFDMIVSGEKKEEYREIKPYYNRILGKLFIGFPFTKAIIKNFESIKDYDEKQIKSNVEIIFRNGYRYNSPAVRCRCTITIGPGIKEWGAIPGQRYYILKILEIMEVRNYGV